jgi:ABC-type transporter Mla MlaB component
MKSKVTKNTKSSTLKIGSMLTIDYTNELHQQFNQSIKQKQPIKVQSELIESIDLSGIQLLITMMKSVSSDTKIDFNLSYSDSTKDLLTKCGFSEILLA